MVGTTVYPVEDGYDFLATGDNDVYYLPLLRRIRDSGIRVRRKVVKYIEVPGPWFWRSKTRWRPLGLVIRHRRTGQYVLFDHDDPEFLDGPALKRLLRDELCIAYFRSQYRPEAAQGAGFAKIRPWIYVEYWPEMSQKHVDRLRRVPRTQTGLFFRGKIDYSKRDQVLLRLHQRGLVDMADVERRVEYSSYLEECSQHQLALGLPGNANLCHREFEAFGMGTTVLMPRHKNQLHEPLIPNHHYVSVELDAEKESASAIAEAVCARYREVEGRTDYLKFVADNAIAWYERNIRFPASLDLTARLIGLERARIRETPFELRSGA